MKGIAQVKQLETLIDLKSSLAAKVIAVIATIALATSCFSISSLAFAAEENSEQEKTEKIGEFDTVQLGDKKAGDQSEPESEDEGEEDSTTDSETRMSTAGEDESTQGKPNTEGVAQIGTTTYASLQEAVAAAQSGQTITLMGNVTIDSTAGKNQATIIIPAGVTLDGGNHTITAGTFANDAHMLGVNNAAGVTIKNLTVDMKEAANSKHALNVWGAGANVMLENVTLKKAKTAGLMLNAGTVSAKNVITEDNGWYGINVDNSGTLTGSVKTNEKIGIFSEDAKDGKSIVDITGYVALYTAKGMIFDTEEKVAAQATAQVEDGAYYSTLQAAIDAAQDGDTVILLADEATNKVIAVNKSITIEGNKHTVSSTANRILWITQNDVNVTLNNIDFQSDVAERGVQVNQYVTGVTLNISNCKIPGTYYAINMCGYTSVTLNIDNCDIRGWGALNLWGSDYDVKVSNSTLVGHNDKSYNADGWNNFGVIVLEGDTTGKTDEHVSGCHVVLEDCHIIASTAVNDGNANVQKAILFNNPSANNTVEIKGANTVVEYAQGDLTPFCAQNGSGNKLIVSGGTFSSNVSDFCVDGFKTAQNEDGTYGFASRYVAAIGETKYESLEEAIRAANADETVELLQDVTVETWHQIWNVNGVTIEGNDHTLTVGKIESGVNGNFLLYQAENLTVNDLTIDLKANNGFDIKSGALQNVTMKAGNSNYAVFVEPGEKVSVEGCSFDGFNIAVYSQPNNGETAAIEVTNSSFTDCGIVMCSYAKDTTFTGNTVSNSDEISFAGAASSNSADCTYTVTNNNFDNAGKIWFYGADLTKVEFSENQVVNGSAVSTEDAQADTTLNLDENYWGGNAPEAIENAEVKNYYKDNEMTDLVCLHQKAVLEAVNPTCTATGLTEGVKCSVCDEVLTAQEAIPALGHAYGEWVVTTPAAEGVAGKQQRTCTRCGEVETQAIEALPANPQDNAGNQGDNTADNGNQQQGNQGGTQQGGQQATAATTVTTATTNADQGTIIADDETPLAAGVDEDVNEDAATADAAEMTIQDDDTPLASFQDQDSNGWLQWLIIPAIILIAGFLFFLLARRRKSDEAEN